MSGSGLRFLRAHIFWIGCRGGDEDGEDERQRREEQSRGEADLVGDGCCDGGAEAAEAEGDHQDPF